MLERASLSSRVHRERGLSLVELMVGITIGMFIVAAAALVLSAQLQDNRKLVADAQMQQDMRAVADLVTRELRRTGYWGHATAGVWSANQPTTLSNPYGTTTSNSGLAAGTNKVEFNYYRGPAADNDVVDDKEAAGFQLKDGVIQMLLGKDNWQALTDDKTLTVTNFNVIMKTDPVPLVCHSACVATNCPPVLNVRTLTVLIEGQSATDAKVKRSVSSTVRLRNDEVTGACP